MRESGFILLHSRNIEVSTACHYCPYQSPNNSASRSGHARTRSDTRVNCLCTQYTRAWSIRGEKFFSTSSREVIFVRNCIIMTACVKSLIGFQTSRIFMRLWILNNSKHGYMKSRQNTRVYLFVFFVFFCFCFFVVVVVVVFFWSNLPEVTSRLISKLYKLYVLKLSPFWDWLL